MKKRIFIFFLILIVGIFSFSACDSNDSDDNSNAALAGNYVLSSMHEKSSGVTFYAGTPTDVGGMEITVSGTLVLAADTYTISMDIQTSFMGETSTESVSESGTYTTSGSTLTITSSIADETATYTYSLIGNELTMENDVEIVVFIKQ